MKYITKTLKGTDLSWDGSVNQQPSYAIGTNQSFQITDNAVEIYRGSEEQPDNSPRPAIKVHRIELLPEWDADFLANQSRCIYNVEVIPFITTLGQGWKTSNNNEATTSNIVFSANTNAEWELNAFSGTSQGIPNDRIYTDPFIIHPYESLFVRLHSIARLGGQAATFTSFYQDESVVTVRIAYEDYDPNERYYGRVSTNDTFGSAGAAKPPEFSTEQRATGYIDFPIIDLYDNSPLLQEDPFTDLTPDNSFHLDSLSFRSGYPFGGFTDTGASASNYMYDIMVSTENNPPALYTLRKYMSYTAGNTGAVLDFQELLKDTVLLQKGQRLFTRIYLEGSALGGAINNQYYYRQAPAFWFDGTVPK